MLGAVDLLQVNDAVGCLDRLRKQKLLVFRFAILECVFAEQLPRFREDADLERRQRQLVHGRVLPDQRRLAAALLADDQDIDRVAARDLVDLVEEAEIFRR